MGARLCYLVLLIAAFCAPALGEAQGKKIWRASIGVLAAASIADAQSSWGRRELNPVLRGGDGRFGGRGLAVKSAVTGGVLLVQWLVVRKHPRVAKAAALTNFAAAGALAGVAARNHAIARQ